MRGANRTPSNDRRSALHSKCGRLENLWVLHSIICDQTVKIAGDIWMQHFYICEGDPSVVAINYSPRPVEVLVDGRRQQLAFRAYVRFVDGHSEYRHVPPQNGKLAVYEDAARSSGAIFFPVTNDWLDEYRQRYRNWARLLPYWRRCQDRPLAALRSALLSRLSDGELTVGQMFDLFPDDEQCLVPAAVATLVRRREIGTDLDEKTWSRHTRLWQNKA